MPTTLVPTDQGAPPPKKTKPKAPSAPPQHVQMVSAPGSLGGATPVSVGPSAMARSGGGTRPAATRRGARGDDASTGRVREPTRTRAAAARQVVAGAKASMGGDAGGGRRDQYALEAGARGAVLIAGGRITPHASGRCDPRHGPQTVRAHARQDKIGRMCSAPRR